MQKPDEKVMFYFLTYCKAVRNGWEEVVDPMLNALGAHGYEVREIGGKWCLVKKIGGELLREDMLK